MNSINNDIFLCVASELSLEHEPVVHNNNEDELRVETRNIMEDTPMQSVDSHTPEQTFQQFVHLNLLLYWLTRPQDVGNLK